MKLVYVTNARVPSEKTHPYQIMKMCEAFRQHGVDVRLIIPWRVQTPEMRAVRNIWEYYGISEKFNIKKIPCLDFLWITYYLHLPPWLDLAIFWLLSISFAAFATVYLFFDRADIYYSRDVLTLGFLSFLKKNLYFERHQKAKLVRLARLLFNRINGLVVITSYLKDFFINLGIPEEKILVAPDGVDLGMFDTSLSKHEARKQLGIPSDEKVVCYTGHLYGWKGAHVLAMSAKYLRATVYFVGGTPDDIQNFRKFIRENDLPNIVVAGHVPPANVPKYLAASDVTVLPNIQEGLSYSTSPLKLFEYMASKRPIVASDLPVIREVLNQENAILVEPGNPEALAGGISTVLDDEELADRIVKKAYREVHQYTWLTRANRILRFVKKRSSLNEIGKWDDYAKDIGTTMFPRSVLLENCGEKILDVGCGLGEHLHSLGERRLKVGVEITRVSINKGRDLFSDVHFTQASAFQLPFRKNCFDTIIMIDVIEHLEKPEIAIKECARVLEKDGRLILQTPNYPVKRIYDIYNYYIGVSWKKTPKDDPTHVSPFTYKKLMKLVSAEFRIKSVFPRNILLGDKLKLIRKYPPIANRVGQKLIVICSKSPGKQPGYSCDI